MGAKWQVVPALSATLALYRIDEKDMSVYINGVTRNIPKAHSTGAEVEINGEFTQDWNVIANYSYDKTKIVEDDVNPDNVGNRLVNAPTNMASLANYGSVVALVMLAAVLVTLKTALPCRTIPLPILL